MSLFSKLFGDGSPSEIPAHANTAESNRHPPLPPGVDQFLPAGGQPAFRASVNASGRDPQTGGNIFRAGAGSSLISQADAEQKAEEAAERNLRAVTSVSSERDAYAYAVDRRLEPVIDSLELEGVPAAKVTVNSYGALIVNAHGALFVDVDTRANDEADEEPDANERAAGRLSAVVAADPTLGFRVYRTRNGWRYLCTSRLYDPAAAETRILLGSLGADAKYVLLCRVQKCFRARLTPKPWRIGERFFEVGPLQSVTRKRLEKYLQKAAPFATARFTSAVGQNGTMDPELRLIVDYHDRWCGADPDKPLA